MSTRNLEGYTQNPVWKFENGNVKVINSSRIAETYRTDDVYYYVTLRRGALYYMINNV